MLFEFIGLIIIFGFGGWQWRRRQHKKIELQIKTYDDQQHSNIMWSECFIIDESEMDEYETRMYELCKNPAFSKKLKNKNMHFFELFHVSNNYTIFECKL